MAPDFHLTLRFNTLVPQDVPAELGRLPDVAAADGGHDLPIFSNLAKDMVPDAPNQIWAGLLLGPLNAGYQ